jgi:hypothetical protein
VLIFLATVSLAAALLYPAWSAREFRARVDTAAGHVETLSRAARSTLTETRSWPTPAPPGEPPPELIGLAGDDGVFAPRTSYRVAWTAWAVVDSVPAPPPPPSDPADPPAPSDGPALEPRVRTVGAVTVTASDPALLAELADRFGTETSFVLDSLWMLVLPERAGP